MRAKREQREREMRASSSEDDEEDFPTVWGYYKNLCYKRFQLMHQLDEELKGIPDINLNTYATVSFRFSTVVKMCGELGEPSLGLTITHVITAVQKQLDKLRRP